MHLGTRAAPPVAQSKQSFSERFVTVFMQRAFGPGVMHFSQSGRAFLMPLSRSFPPPCSPSFISRPSLFSLSLSRVFFFSPRAHGPCRTHFGFAVLVSFCFSFLFGWSNYSWLYDISHLLNEYEVSWSTHNFGSKLFLGVSDGVLKR